MEYYFKGWKLRIKPKAASWVSGKAKEAGTWIDDKVKSAWDNIFQSNNNDKLKGKPGEIKRNGKQETKIGNDGRAIKERHNTDHGNLNKMIGDKHSLSFGISAGFTIPSKLMPTMKFSFLYKVQL